jgi:hypothetical protein
MHTGLSLSSWHMSSIHTMHKAYRSELLLHPFNEKREGAHRSPFMFNEAVIWHATTIRPSCAIVIKRRQHYDNILQRAQSRLLVSGSQLPCPCSCPPSSSLLTSATSNQMGLMKVFPEAVFFSLICSGLALFRTWIRPSTRRLIRVCMNALEHCTTAKRCAQQA